MYYAARSLVFTQAMRVCFAITASSLSFGAVSQDTIASESDVEVIAVYGDQGASRTATKLDLSVYETPQTITVVSRQQIDDFSLHSINDLLSYTPGVTVESVETDRTYYTARGFDVVNFQYDGLGVPFSSGLTNGQFDTAAYEQIEVIKGAAGLVTGLANPSATVNFIRKRPTKDLAAYSTLYTGSNSMRRAEGDISGSLTAGLRGRAVVALDSADSYLDRKSDDNRLLYLVGEYDLTGNTLLTLGHSANKNKVDGSMSGALPLYYTDGSPTDYDVATNTATDWAYRDVETKESFAQVRQQLSGNWSLNLMLTQTDSKMDSELFYVYGTPERGSELGLLGSAYGYTLDETQKMADVYLTGQYSLAGRQHELMLGLNYAHIDLFGQSFYDYETGYPVLGSDWGQGNTVKGVFDDTDPYSAGHKDKQIHQSAYLATRLHLTDDLTVLAGARMMSVKQGGYNYGVDASTDADETVPYIGAMYQLNSIFSVYGSYSEVFTPQSFVDAEFNALGVARGEHMELGSKVSLNDGRAIASVALFRSDLNNVGEFAGVINGVNTYNGLDYSSEGIELELIGSVTDQLNLSMGYTWLNSVEGDAGQQVRTYVPRNLLKLSGVYYPDLAPALSVGASIHWQDSVYTSPEPGITITQSSYALLDLFVRYQFSDNLSLTLNGSNITGKKYYESLYWTQAYYGAPSQWQASVTWRY
ncbi:TonB-dependent siderophore receptor [Rheinheimera sp. NSM]|uniref:TonB-dependent siderophore receptor n=1 Tax=Rheinheimera sp. NSM TaxID=3457884 RepID=UPI004036FCAF